MNTLFLFIVLSGIGATMIVSKGDILKPFRDAILSLSKKNKHYRWELVVPSSVNLMDESVRLVSAFYHKDFIQTKRENMNQHIFFEGDVPEDGIILSVGGYVNVEYPFIRTQAYDSVKWITFIHDMISCPQCCGVWVGMLWYIIYLLGGFDTILIKMLCTGCIVSLGAMGFFKIVQFLEKK